MSWIWRIKGHREFICGQRTPQFIVFKGHNIWKVTMKQFVAGNIVYVFFQEDIFSNIHIWAIFLSWIWRIKGHREFICGQRTPQFIVFKGHNIWKVTMRQFVAGVLLSSLFQLIIFSFHIMNWYIYHEWRSNHLTFLSRLRPHAS